MAIQYKGNQYVAERGSFFRDSVMIDGDFIVGGRSTFWQNLNVTGKLYLCPECQIRGNIVCSGGVIGRGCNIDGDMTAGTGSLILCDNSTVGCVSTEGDVLVRPGVSAKEIYGDLITVVGKVRCGKLMGKKTRLMAANSS